jgi:hypothetical protein
MGIRTGPVMAMHGIVGTKILMAAQIPVHYFLRKRTLHKRRTPIANKRAYLSRVRSATPVYEAKFTLSEVLKRI